MIRVTSAWGKLAKEDNDLLTLPASGVQGTKLFCLVKKFGR